MKENKRYIYISPKKKKEKTFFLKVEKMKFFGDKNKNGEKLSCSLLAIFYRPHPLSRKKSKSLSNRRRHIQHDDILHKNIQYNDTPCNGTQHDTQQNNSHCNSTGRVYAE
jgi:hypothetical protein